MRVITLTVALVYLLSILARAPVIWYLVLFLFCFEKFIWYEIQLIDELVDDAFEPLNARVAFVPIRRHIANCICGLR